MSRYALSSSVDLSPTIPTLKQVSLCEKWRLLFWKNWRHRRSKSVVTGAQLVVPWLLFLSVVSLGIGPRKARGREVGRIRLMMDEHETLRFLSTVQMVLPLSIVLTTLFLPLTIVKPITKEKTRGIWNLLQLKGISRWMQWLSWFSHEFLILLCNILAILLLLKCSVTSDGPVFPSTCVYVIFLTLFIYFVVSLTACLFFSCLIENDELAWPVWCLFSLVTLILPMSLDEAKLKMELEPGDLIASHFQLLTCLFPNSALYWAIHIISTYEARRLGMQWEYLTTTEYEYLDSVTLAHIFTIWFVDAIFFSAFTWYLDNVFPGRLKMQKPFYFPLMMKYWSTGELFSPIKMKMIESLDKPLQFTIGLSHIYKKDDNCKQYILNNINVQFECGEITVLYGMEKSGKSTIVSIVAGFVEPTSGTISIKTELPKGVSIGERLGFCPQTDIMLYNFLTVKEHLLFHARLAGKQGPDLQSEVSFILISLDLQTQQTWPGQVLPKDVQRRLGIGMALVSNQGLIILDEPTLDVDSRMKPRIWKLLRKYRHRSCIVVATKCAREANELAGKIVVVRSGKIKMFRNNENIERSIGAGYNLVLKINKNADISPITELITRHIVQARVLVHSGDDLSYRLPLEAKELFPDVLFELEKNKSDFLVHNINVHVTSFECALINFAEPAEYVTEENILTELHMEQINDFRIFQLTQQQIREKWSHILQQILGLFYKRWCFIFHRKQLLLPQLLTPVIITIFAVYFNLMSPALVHSHQLLVMAILDSHLNVTATDDKLVFSNSTNLAYSKRIPSVRMLLLEKTILLSLLIPFCLSIILCSFIVFPVEERTSQFKKLQMMSGVGRFYLWSVSLVWDFAVYCVCLIFLVLILTTEDAIGLLKDSNQNAILIAIFLLNGWASIPFVYVISFMTKNSTASYFNLLNSMLITGIIFPTVVLFSSLSDFPLISAVGWILSWLFRLFPNFCCIMSVMKIIEIALGACQFIHPDTLADLCSISQLPPQVGNCCQKKISKEEEIWSSGVVEDMLSLAACGLFYLLCVWLYELDSKDKPWSLFSRMQSLFWFLPRDSLESDVLSIAAYSNRAIHLDRVSRRVGATELIKSISLSIKCGECIGLLGASRACKSSLLQMIAGVERADQGKITLFDTTFEADPKKYFSQLGYCPQTCSLMDSLTTREILYLFSMLKGVIDVDLTIDDLIAVFHLEEERNLLVKHHDSVTRQKVSIALSVISGPPILLLDEPTTGFDGESAIQVWKLMKTFLRLDRTVVMAPSSLPECVALCSRVAVLSNGRLIHFGKTSEIRGDFGDGVTIVILMNYFIDHEATITLLDQFMDSKFEGCSMIRLYESAICFHLPNFKVQWSYLFAVMEEAKEMYELQNYSLSRTTVAEMLFLLSFKP